MAFKDGHKKVGGRKKGSTNKVPAKLKEAILEAAERAGNKRGKEGAVSYLEAQADDNPVAFMGLLGKVLPMTVAGEGENGEITLTLKAPWMEAD